MNDSTIDITEFATEVASELRRKGERPVAVAVMRTPGTDEAEIRLAVALAGKEAATAHRTVAAAGFAVKEGAYGVTSPPNGSVGFSVDSPTVVAWRRFPWHDAGDGSRRVSGFWQGYGFGSADILYLEDENGHVIRDFPKVATHR